MVNNDKDSQNVVVILFSKLNFRGKNKANYTFFTRKETKSYIRIFIIFSCKKTEKFGIIPQNQTLAVIPPPHMYDLY